MGKSVKGKSVKRKSRKVKTHSRKTRGGMDNNNINNINEIDEIDVDMMEDGSEDGFDWGDGMNEFDDDEDVHFMIAHNQIPFFYDKATKTYTALGPLNKFPDNIPRDTKILMLHNKNITEIPDSIGQLTNLESFMINDNKINKISPEIGKLTKLRGLNLGNNELTEIPSEIGNLTNLEELFLNKNKLTSLPPEIGKLSKLELLILNNNEFTELPPEVTNLTNLEELYLKTNNLKTLPPGMDKLVNLKELYLNNNPELETLPVELTKLPKLKTVISIGNNYEWLDDAVVKKFGNKLPGPIPNQDWNTKMNIQEFNEQNTDDNPFISKKLNKDVAIDIFSFLPSQQQKELIKSRNINKGGRKTRRRKSSRKKSGRKSRRHR